jgi:putative transposase
MPFSRCYYHVVWATRNRQPIISAPVEKVILEAVRDQCLSKGFELLAINGTDDHVHVALTIPPSYSVADAVARLKGVSSRRVNAAFPDAIRFEWQKGYGVHTFGERAMPQLLNYIANQKKHHGDDTTHNYLERIED